MLYIILQEFQIAEQPSIITLIESATGGNSDTCSICVGYKHQFDIITDGSGTAQRLFTVQEGTKAHLVSATDLYEDEEPELLLCYNSTHECSSCPQCSTVMLLGRWSKTLNNKHSPVGRILFIRHSPLLGFCTIIVYFKQNGSDDYNNISHT